MSMSLNITSTDRPNAKKYREIYRTGVAGSRGPRDKEP